MVVGDDPAVLVLYVDDLFLSGSKKLIVRCKREMTSKFKDEESRTPTLLLRIRSMTEIERYIFLSQRKYTVEILQRFGMIYCKSMMTTTEANLKKQLQTQSWWTLLCTGSLLDP